MNLLKQVGSSCNNDPAELLDSLERCACWLPKTNMVAELCNKSMEFPIQGILRRRQALWSVQLPAESELQLHIQRHGLTKNFGKANVNANKSPVLTAARDPPAAFLGTE